LREYRDDSKEFVRGLTETLEAEVRSKFQTERRMRDAARGIAVEVPFDNALVKYLWVSERELRVEEITLFNPNLAEYNLDSEHSDEDRFQDTITGE